jgi:two-component system, OmpR family, sensor histidine kinase MprB
VRWAGPSGGTCARTLRTRFALAFAVVAFVVAAMVGLLSYHAAADRIYQEVDASLRSTATAIDNGQTTGLAAPALPDRGRGHEQSRQVVAQTVAPDGTVTSIGTAGPRLPVSDATLAIAGGSARSDAIETDVDDESYRILTVPRTGGGALQVAVEVEDVEHVLGGMANEIALASIVVLVIAAAAGWLLARRITRRLEALAGVAEDISEHGGVDRQVPVEGVDEVGRLSSAFNTMVTRLAAARDAQERLIQDAAHELRTPLTSLRTNASVLRRIGDLSPDGRNRLVDDVQGETRELSNLVDELVELALDRRGDDPDKTVDLTALAEHAAQRVTRRTGRRIRIDADDATHVFDRFYRASAARSLPGSDLGLSIVADVAQAHGGTVFAGSRPGGGAEVGFTVGSDRLLPGFQPGHDVASPRTATLEET